MKTKWSLASAIKICFPIAAVEFGLLCGPSMASGAYASNYFSKWGVQGLGMILFWCVLMAISTFFGIFFASAYDVHNYSEFYKAMYGRVYKYASPLLEIYMFCSNLISEAAQLTLGGVMFNSLFGWHPLVGATIMAAIIIILTLYGDKLVRRASTVMTFVLLFGFVVLLFYAINIKGGVIAQYLGDYNIYEKWGVGTLGMGYWTVFLYALSVMNAPITLCNVNQKMRPGVKDSAVVAILTAVTVGLLFVITYFITVGFMPDVLSESTPNLWIATTQIRHSWVVMLYYVVMFFALASSGPAITFGFSNRWKGVIFKNKKASEKVQLGTISVVFNIICILFSQVGLTAIITTGFTTLGKFGGPLIIAPMVFTTFHRARRKLKERGLESGGEKVG